MSNRISWASFDALLACKLHAYSTSELHAGEPRAHGSYLASWSSALNYTAIRKSAQVLSFDDARWEFVDVPKAHQATDPLCPMPSLQQPQFRLYSAIRSFLVTHGDHLQRQLLDEALNELLIPPANRSFYIVQLHHPCHTASVVQVNAKALG